MYPSQLGLVLLYLSKMHSVTTNNNNERCLLYSTMQSVAKNGSAVLAYELHY